MKINKSTLRQLPFMAPIFRVEYEVFERGTGYSEYGNVWDTANPHGLMASAQRRAELAYDHEDWTTDNFSWRKTSASAKVFVGDVYERRFFQPGLVQFLRVPFVTPGYPVRDLWDLYFDGMPTYRDSSGYDDDNYTEDYGDDYFEASYDLY